MPTPPRIFAIDWSGDRLNGRRKIWLAEVCRGELVRLENGRSREDIARLLIEEAMKDARFIVGLDFAFSFPVWFCAKLGVKTAFEVWAQAARDGEGWLHSCAIPFWGRSGTTCPTEGQRFRKTELDCASNGSGTRPKSVFQIGGAGAVGTGSIRGMPILKTLHEAGFSIWPFDPPGWPRVVEIYPRVLTGPVNKSSRDARQKYLRMKFPELSKRFLTVASSCEDAFDAAVSALVMHTRIDELASLSQATDPCDLLRKDLLARPQHGMSADRCNFHHGFVDCLSLGNYCNVLRDDGMSYVDYVEQLTYLLFLKMVDEWTNWHNVEN